MFIRKGKSSCMIHLAAGWWASQKAKEQKHTTDGVCSVLTNRKTKIGNSWGLLWVPYFVVLFVNIFLYFYKYIVSVSMCMHPQSLWGDKNIACWKYSMGSGDFRLSGLALGVLALESALENFWKLVPIISDRMAFCHVLSNYNILGS